MTGPNANWLPCKGRDVAKIIFGEDVEQVCTYAFCECKPSVVESLRPTPPVLGSGCLYSTDKRSCALIVPDGAKYDYSTAAIWREFSNVSVSGIDVTPIDAADMPVEIYNLNGTYLGSNLERLAPGVYVIRQGKTVRKHIIR